MMIHLLVVEVYPRRED